MLPVLRALFPWYGVLITGVLVDVVCWWIYKGTLAQSVQIAIGATAGVLVAMGVVMKVHEMRRPDDIWFPANRTVFVRGAKVIGIVAGVAASIDQILRHTSLPHAGSTVFFATGLAVVASVLARTAKLSTSEKGN